MSAEVGEPRQLKRARRRQSKRLGILLVLIMLGSFTYFTTGLFVVQPIGALPKGVTIWYWRCGTRLPFICSPDGLLLQTQGSVSLMGRAAVLASLVEPVKKREIVSLPYSRTLYLISTKGCELEQ